MAEELAAEVQQIIEKDPLEIEDIQRLRALVGASDECRCAMRSAVESLSARTGKAAEAAVAPLAACLFALGRVAEARPRFEEMKRTKVGSFYLACCATEMGDYVLAADLFEKALQVSPTLTEALWRRVEALAIVGHADARKAVKELPKDRQRASDRQYLEALCLETEGDLGGAIEAYREILNRHPDHRKTLFRLAYVLDLVGEDVEAIDAYERCVETSGPFANALINLGVLYEDAGRFVEAMRCFKQVLVIDPNHERARLFLKDAWASLDMYYDEEAERRMDKRNRVLEIPITDFELSVRSRNCLERINIRTLGDLTRVTERELLGYKNFGETSLNEIKAILAQKGLQLGQAIEDSSQGAEAFDTGPTIPYELLAKPIADLELSVRARRCMEHLSVNTVEELLRKSERELLDCKNFGQTSMNEVKQKLVSLGLSLRPE
ncbi:MAG: DNA-directed RNA polymerase subunit alpha C-terminal domain-containing protein [Planctomycetota bacterium]